MPSVGESPGGRFGLTGVSGEPPPGDVVLALLWGKPNIGIFRGAARGGPRINRRAPGPQIRPGGGPCTSPRSQSAPGPFDPRYAFLGNRL